jgi:DNA-binding response OmpR family regulator
MICPTAKILIVDDAPSLVATREYTLRRDGHEVAIARDGAAA